MELKDILAKCDHTLLLQPSTWAEIQAICDDGMKYETASVCIPASFVKQAKEYVGDRLAICTVIGFPNGYSTTAVKCFEASDAVDNGADEIDMVINIGWAKDGKWDEITAEIAAIKQACKGKLLKVIIETCLLTDEEKIALCKCVSDSGADYIKTSTGFSKAGATFADVELFAKHVAPHVKIKAAGGISSIEDAEKFIALGADRLGTSRIVKIAKGLENDGTYFFTITNYELQIAGEFLVKENVIVRKSFAFSVRIVNLQKYLVNRKHEYILSKQICKSGTSIGANVAEAQRAQSTADFVAKLKIALKEANETQYWLQLLYETEYLTDREFKSLHNDLLEILRILTAICKHYPQSNQ